MQIAHCEVIESQNLIAGTWYLMYFVLLKNICVSHHYISKGRFTAVYFMPTWSSIQNSTWNFKSNNNGRKPKGWIDSYYVTRRGIVKRAIFVR